MRYVSIDLSSDNHLQQPQIFGGYAGEHNETVLRVKLPARMIGIECSGYRFDFQTSEDNKISSPLIQLNNDILSFDLSEQLTVAGKLFFNVAAILLDDLNDNSVSLISKTNMVTLYIEDSPEGNTQLINPSSYKDELQKMIDERVSEMNLAPIEQSISVLNGKVNSLQSTALRREIVDNLPEDFATSEKNVVYMVPSSDSEENNFYNEYLFVYDTDVYVDSAINISNITFVTATGDNLEALANSAEILNEIPIFDGSFEYIGYISVYSEDSQSYLYEGHMFKVCDIENLYFIIDTLKSPCPTELEEFIINYISEYNGLPRNPYVGELSMSGWHSESTDSLNISGSALLFKFEQIGSSKCDLSGYCTKEENEIAFRSKQDKFGEVEETRMVLDPSIETIGHEFSVLRYGESTIELITSNLNYDGQNSSIEIAASLNATNKTFLLHGVDYDNTNEEGIVDIPFDVIVRGVATPKEDNDAVNKVYIDNLIGDINSVLATIVDGVEDV